MKKKGIAMLVALACAVLCAFALVACGDDKGGNGGGGTGAQAVVSDKVTSAQWGEALSPDKLTQGKVEAVQTRSGDMQIGSNEWATGTMTTTMTYTFAGEKQHSKAVVTATGDAAIVTMATAYDGFEQYSWEIDEKIYINYAQNMQDRTKWDWEVTEYSLLGLPFRMAYLCAECFGDFTYSDAQKGYVAREDSYMGSVFDGLFVLKFKNNKLSAVYSEEEYTEDGKTVKSTQSYVITYGEQTVTLPTMPASEYAGEWKLYAVDPGGYEACVDTPDNNTLTFGPDANLTIEPDQVVLTINSDGTASFSFMEDVTVGGEDFSASGDGAWWEEGPYIRFISNAWPGAYENNIYMSYEGGKLIFNMTIRIPDQNGSTTDQNLHVTLKKVGA